MGGGDDRDTEGRDGFRVHGMRMVKEEWGLGFDED